VLAGMIVCRVCGIKKAATKFSRDLRSSRSYRSVCKDCEGVRKRAYNQLPRVKEMRRIYDRLPRVKESKRERERVYRQLPFCRERMYWNKARYYQKYPEKRRAHSVVEQALKNGLLVRPEACSVCGTQRKLHAHHDDYFNALDVRWLCEECHSFVHRKVNETRQLIEA